MRILIRLSYLGTNYHGWQVQPNGVTVQETVQNAIEQLYGVRLGVTGCSRTDAGVHTNEFYCHYDTEKYIAKDGVVAALNIALPNDIVVTECEYVADDFHARYSSTGKEYVYQIYCAKTPNPFLYGRCWYLNKKLDTDAMNVFAKGLIGKHDFIGFSSSGRTVEDTVRTIYDCNVSKEGNLVTVKVSADGFLYNMVRIIVGTLVDVSDGKIDKNSAAKILESRERKNAGATAPAQGLFLNKVFY